MALKILGDPHLGRVFRNGVPLHRRGEREKAQWDQFREHLFSVKKGDIHVCMGDLFDNFIVPPEVVMATAELYNSAALANSQTHYIIIRGNHDASRDAYRKSSFDLFNMLVRHNQNVVVVQSWGTIVGKYGFVPWDPFKSAAELVAEMPQDHPYEAIFGHWDIQSFSGNDHNLIPLEQLARLTKRVYTGHVHRPSEFEYGDMLVTVTGSMQPYAHGEDPDDALYVTKTLAEVEADPEAYKDKCLRILLQPGEVPPDDIDCLQLAWKRIDAPDDDGPPPEVEVGKFDFAQLFRETLRDRGVKETVIDDLWASYEAARSETVET